MEKLFKLIKKERKFFKLFKEKCKKKYIFAVGTRHYYKQTSNVLCFIQDVSYCQKEVTLVEWNISRGIYINSEFTSTSHCCLGYIWLHEEQGKAWQNYASCKMIRFESKTRTSTDINIVPRYKSSNNGHSVCVLQNLEMYSWYVDRVPLLVDGCVQYD